MSQDYPIEPNMFRPSAHPRSFKEHCARAARAFNRARLHFGHGTDNAIDDSFQLALAALGWTQGKARRELDRPLTAAQSAILTAAFQRRIRTRMPSAYLTGEAVFAGLRFHVDPRVLIPRSPMAELIEARFWPWLRRPPSRILDLCAGSGCIGIACARVLPKARVDLIELDAGACAVCQRNLRRHRLAGRVRCIQSDLFKKAGTARYDLIVSNPPYVPESEWRRLPAEYRHEPRLALAAGRDGMDLVARILAQAADHLAPEGVLICEVGGSVAQFEKRFPRFTAVWPEFERGGDGVFIISREELIRWNKNARVR